MVNFHSLMIFYNVVKEGSIKNASIEIGMSRGSISKSIARLEETLGKVLLVNGDRGEGLVPNLEGKKLYDTIRKPMSELIVATKGSVVP